jgi:hypothetical protein
MWFIFQYAWGEWHKVQHSVGAPVEGFASYNLAEDYMDAYLEEKFSEMTHRGLDDKYKRKLALSFKIEFVEV